MTFVDTRMIIIRSSGPPGYPAGVYFCRFFRRGPGPGNPDRFLRDLYLCYI